MRGTSVHQPAQPPGNGERADSVRVSVGDALSLSVAHARGLHLVAHRDCWRCDRAAAGRGPSRTALYAPGAAGQPRVFVSAGDEELGAVLAELLAERGCAPVLVPRGHGAAPVVHQGAALAVIEITPHIADAGRQLLHTFTIWPALQSVPVLLYGSDATSLGAAVAARLPIGPTASLTMPFDIDAFFGVLDSVLPPTGAFAP